MQEPLCILFLLRGFFSHLQSFLYLFFLSLFLRFRAFQEGTRRYLLCIFERRVGVVFLGRSRVRYKRNIAPYNSGIYIFVKPLRVTYALQCKEMIFGFIFLKRKKTLRGYPKSLFSKKNYFFQFHSVIKSSPISGEQSLSGS